MLMSKCDAEQLKLSSFRIVTLYGMARPAPSSRKLGVTTTTPTRTRMPTTRPTRTLRRTAAGRLSELVGPPALDTDELMRRFDLSGAAETSLDVQTPYTSAALDAYAAGVNARIAEAPGWGALERITRGRPGTPSALTWNA